MELVQRHRHLARDLADLVVAEQIARGLAAPHPLLLLCPPRVNEVQQAAVPSILHQQRPQLPAADAHHAQRLSAQHVVVGHAKVLVWSAAGGAGAGRG
jgi:hypothetical protein